MSDDKEEKYHILDNNANAVRAVMQAVESTIGPKGLDTMLVDQFGEVIITNDGITILSLMEVNHPIAKMIINAVRAQQEEVGDGTTTTALMAGEMVLSGLDQLGRGVPVAQVIQGLRRGVAAARQAMSAEALAPEAITSGQLYNIALIAGREYGDIAQLVVQAAEMVGQEKLRSPSFRLADGVTAIEGAAGEVFQGVLLTKERLDSQMPLTVEGPVKILVIDDALEPEEFDDEALATESGFQAYLDIKNQFRTNIRKIIDSGAQVVLVDRGVNSEAEEMLSDSGVMVVARVPHKELQAAAEHTGARMLKRTGLKKTLAELEKNLGTAERVAGDEKLQHVKVLGGSGKAAATVVIGASTGEIVGERERIAKDAAASVQAAIRQGLVAGGGAAELAAARALESQKNDLPGMTAFGMECVINGLRRPFMQMVANAGFNPLEKLGDVNKAQVGQGNHHLGIDCDTGEITDLMAKGIVDPLHVKQHGLQVAGEVAEAILRINIIIKKKAYQPEGA